jgi:hypothetical protein
VTSIGFSNNRFLGHTRFKYQIVSDSLSKGHPIIENSWEKTVGLKLTNMECP